MSVHRLFDRIHSSDTRLCDSQGVTRLSRRKFIGGLATVVATAGLPRRAFAELTAPRVLSFTHLHTGERLAVEYFSGDVYLTDALSTIDHLLRDFRTGEVHAIDPKLLDLLHGLTTLTGTTRPFEVICGYRSPATNQMLRARSEGVAASSLHLKGQAIDIRLADIPLGRLRDAALDISQGGVGYYPRSNFVHADTGRVRWW